MKGKIIKDWSQVNFKDPANRKQIRGALQHFMRAVDKKNSPVRKAIQAFSTKGDFPTEILQVLEKYHATPDYDLGYEQIFDIRDFTGTNQSGFDIVNVESGLTFSKVGTGEKAKVFKMSGEKISVSFDKYGGGLHWDRTLIDDKQYWTLEDNAIAFRNKAYSSRAEAFYTLIEAVTNTTSWQAVTPASVAASDKDYNAIRDVNTINKACLDILTAVKDKGIGANANSQFKLLAPLALKGRILRALALLQQSFAGSQGRLSFNVTPIFTLMLSSNSYYYVALPGAKLKGGYRMDLTLYDQFDILAYADTMAGWMRYGGAIGDTEQIKKVSTS
jgi:hypothetical protein